MRRVFGLVVFGLMCSAPLAAATRPAGEEPREAAASAPVAVQRVSSVSGIHVRDEAAMVLVGTALIGLAAAVRRAA